MHIQKTPRVLFARGEPFSDAVFFCPQRLISILPLKYPYQPLPSHTLYLICRSDILFTVSVFLPCRAFIRHRLFWFFHNRQPFFTCSITVFHNRSSVMHYILLNTNTSIYRPLSVCRPNAFLTGIRRLQSCRQLRVALCPSRIILSPVKRIVF